LRLSKLFELFEVTSYGNAFADGKKESACG
jgi:hypothetical protein